MTTSSARSVRAFTITELAVVLVIVGVATALGLSSTTATIAAARYRADRARLFLETQAARDDSTDQRSARVMVVTGSHIDVRSGATCPAALVGPVVNAFDVGALRSLTPGLCFDSGARSGAVTAISFDDGAGGPSEVVSSVADGRLADSWGEFGQEGALEATACDVDTDPACGK
ncbi:MAG: hypothetical protein Q8O67_06905 [Deltaproteobacteria bacterium]|nr:hypothetical protein [Deltaproteobacteria bacterium]